MGDTGSMLIGFIISILAIKFIENNRVPGIEESEFYIKAAPGVAVAVVLVPLFDMSRVFFQRIAKGKHPFTADRRHIHHMLMDIGWSHTQIALSLYLTSLLLIAVSILLKELRSMVVITVLIGICSILTYVIFSRKKLLSRQEKDT